MHATDKVGKSESTETDQSIVVFGLFMKFVDNNKNIRPALSCLGVSGWNYHHKSCVIV